MYITRGFEAASLPELKKRYVSYFALSFVNDNDIPWIEDDSYNLLSEEERQDFIDSVNEEIYGNRTDGERI